LSRRGRFRILRWSTLMGLYPVNIVGRFMWDSTSSPAEHCRLGTRVDCFWLRWMILFPFHCWIYQMGREQDRTGS
jgi:hypothetical protein